MKVVTWNVRGACSPQEIYAGNLNNHYSGVVLIVRDKYYPQVVHNDPYGRFLVLEITFFGEVVWEVGIYAPNQATQRIALWGAKPYLWVVQDYLWVILTCVLMHLNLRLNIQ